MLNDKIADRIAKLLAIADKAGTPEEAATSFALAQQLAERHCVNAERIAAAEAMRNGARVDEPIVSAIIMTLAVKVAPVWIGHVAIAVATCNRGAVRYGRVGLLQNGSVDPRVTIIAHGTATDLAVMAAMLPAIVHQIERLCDDWVAADAARAGRASRDSYRKGAAKTVSDRLSAAVAEARKALKAEASAEVPVFALPVAGSGEAAEVGPSTALVLVQAAIETMEKRGEDAVHAMHVAMGRPRAKKAYRSSTSRASDNGAYSAGKRDGHKVSLAAHRVIR